MSHMLLVLLLVSWISYFLLGELETAAFLHYRRPQYFDGRFEEEVLQVLGVFSEAVLLALGPGSSYSGDSRE